MGKLTFVVVEDGRSPLRVDGMGEGMVVLSQPSPTGRLERVEVTLAQLAQLMEALQPRYEELYSKNTEPSERELQAA